MSRWWAWGGIAALVACARPPVSPAADDTPSPRRPDGVHLEPPRVFPKLEDKARARGVVALRLPLADGALEEVVMAFFGAFLREDLESLERQTLTPDWSVIGAPPGARATLTQTWRTRVRSYDYKTLQGAEIIRPADIERFDSDDLGTAGAPARPSEMREGDVLVRVRVVTARVGADVYFPDRVLFLLRQNDQGRYRIAGVSEDGGIP